MDHAHVFRTFDQVLDHNLADNEQSLKLGSLMVFPVERMNVRQFITIDLTPAYVDDLIVSLVVLA